MLRVNWRGSLAAGRDRARGLRAAPRVLQQKAYKEPLGRKAGTFLSCSEGRGLDANSVVSVVLPAPPLPAQPRGSELVPTVRRGVGVRGEGSRRQRVLCVCMHTQT